MFEQLIAFEGIQRMSSQNMPLWHIGYFELKTLEKQQVEGGPLTFLFLPRNRRYNPYVQGALLDWEVNKETFLSLRTRS